MPWLNRRKPPPIRSLIGEGLVVRGHLRFREGLRVDGEVHGDLIAEEGRSLLVIGEKARVVGKVRAGHVIINGEVEGPVWSEELLELQPKAQVTGDVRYLVLEMHPGSRVDGVLHSAKTADRTTRHPTIETSADKLMDKAAEKRALTLAASNDA